ncbi:hypothetical protein OHA61_08770 [Streptomyces sp. NBC_00885]|uniref:hypothetical protein n=1 Tax=Streptomyces sp. NBC_00885 TaxID=2975857 RepID=UPI00386C9749|nr:hypothetical protein OHA61_08770 [Streptomyces sp. NBC_00885]
MASIQREMACPGQQPVVRVGLDGKVRPLNSAESRRRAAEIITENPMTSLRGRTARQHLASHGQRRP